MFFLKHDQMPVPGTGLQTNILTISVHKSGGEGVEGRAEGVSADA